MDPYTILIYPLVGEKATTMRELENRLTFIVNKTASKKQVKDAIEKLYNVEVKSVNTMITTTGHKKAHIRLTDKYSAEEIASHFGVL